MTSLRKRIPELPAPLDRVGRTPLIDLGQIDGVEVRLKAEWTNPGGSVKDRPALAMVLDGLDEGELPDKTLVDATSGNTGIAYALCAAVLDFDVTLVMPENVSDERKRILEVYGADVEFTDPLEGQDGAIEQVRELVDDDPGAWFYPDQYGNPANPRAHRETTGPEILDQADGRVTHVVAGLGTTGTLMGLADALGDEASIVGLEPDSGFHGIEGLKHMGTSIVPSIFDPGKLDDRRGVTTEAAYDAARRLGRRGLLVGQSAGAVWAGIEELAAELDDGMVVGIGADGADKYWSTGMWDEA